MTRVGSQRHRKRKRKKRGFITVHMSLKLAQGTQFVLSMKHTGFIQNKPHSFRLPALSRLTL
jgi:hypothetical protein